METREYTFWYETPNGNSRITSILTAQAMLEKFNSLVLDPMVVKIEVYTDIETAWGKHARPFIRFDADVFHEV